MPQPAARLGRPKSAARRLEPARPTAAQRGYGSAWQKARAGFLAQHPLCVDCLAAGRTTAATEVDHVIPHRGDRAKFWDASNWAARCKPCHSRKTARGE